VKIASQPFRVAPPPNLCALCGESLRPFRITNLQIPLPACPPDSWWATPFLSHPCKSPGVSPSVGSVLRTPCPLCCAFSFNSFVASRLQPLVLSLLSFPPSCPLFSIVCRLFSQNAGVRWASRMPVRDTRGGGYPVKQFQPAGRPKVGQPFLAVLRRSLNNPPSKPNGGPMPYKGCSPIQPTYAVPPNL
jgi:hypothetical protein